MASAEEPCQFEIKFADQQEANPIPVYSNHTNLISGAQKAAVTGETLKAIPRAFEGLIRPRYTSNGRILVYVITDAADTIESEECQWEIPMIVYDLQGNVVTRKVLTQENMTGFTQAGTVDVACAAGVPARVAYFDVPRNLAMGIDPNGKIRAYIGDDTA